MPFEFSADFSGWDSLLTRMPQSTADVLEDIADAIVFDEIQGHWSGSSPSSPGNPPAVVTGALDQSITSYQIAGGFNPAFQIDASGMDYAGYLEDGTSKMAARPFFAPAMERAKKYFTASAFKVIFD